MSVRAVGEGHVSSIEFRTGVLSAAGAVTHRRSGTAPAQRAGRARTDVARIPGRRTAERRHRPGDRLHSEPAARRVHGRSTSTRPSPPFAGERLTRGSADADRRADPLDRLMQLPAAFPAGPPAVRTGHLSRPARTRATGVEDARFTRFVEDDGGVAYYATYTAFDGDGIAPHLLQTEDFRTFDIGHGRRPGRDEQGHGAVPAPHRRPISRRCPGGTGRTTASPARPTAAPWSDGRHRPDARAPGNSSSSATAARRSRPTDGWLVLTHGVGPMRELRRSAPSCSTWTIPRESSARWTSRC